MSRDASALTRPRPDALDGDGRTERHHALRLDTLTTWAALELRVVDRRFAQCGWGL